MSTNYQDIIVKMEADRQAKKAKLPEQRRDILKKMLELKLPCIKVSFAGYGDSGSIDEIKIVSDASQNTWDGTPLEDKHSDLNKQIEDYCYSYLESTGVDWYNNEGGQGHFTFDAFSIPPEFHCTVEYNVMNTEIGHEATEVM